MKYRIALLVIMSLLVTGLAAAEGTEPLPVCATPESCMVGAYATPEDCTANEGLDAQFGMQDDETFMNQYCTPTGACQYTASTGENVCTGDTTPYFCDYRNGLHSEGETCSEVDPIEDPDPSDTCNGEPYDPAEQTCCSGDIVEGDSCDEIDGGDPIGPDPGDCTEDGENCDSTPVCEAEAFEVSITAGHVIGEKKIAMNWELEKGDTNCLDLIDTFVYRYNSTSYDYQEELITSPSPQTTDYLSAGLKEDTKYDVQLTVSFTDPQYEPITAYDHITLGHEECFKAQRQYCRTIEETVICGPENRNTGGVCNGGEDSQVCAQSQDPSGRTSVECRATPPCEECNEAFENYQSQTTDKRVPYTTPTGQSTNPRCSAFARAQSDGQGNQFGVCTEDHATGALMKLRACGEISSCNSYRTESACTTNACLVGAGGTCDWDESINVCLNSNGKNTCDVPEPNKDICENIPGCGFDGDDCLSEDDFVCDVFDDSEDACVGETGNFQLNEDNTHNTVSTNDFKLQKCAWINENSCLKYAGRTYPDNTRTTLSVDIAGDLAKDFGNPTTQMLTKNPNKLFIPEERIHFAASDEKSNIVYTRAHLRTGYCDENDIQRPSKEDNEITPGTNFLQLPSLEELEGVQPLEFCLEYYSKDLALNYEPVKQQDITMTTTQVAWDSFAVTKNPLSDMNTQVILDFNVTRPSTCTIEQDGKEVFSGKGSNFWWDTELGPDQYLFEVSCDSDLGSLYRNESVYLYKGSLEINNFEKDFTRPDSQSPTTAEFSFTTNPAATCDPHINNNAQPPTSTETTTDHAVSYELEEPGEYVFEFSCTAPNVGSETTLTRTTVLPGELVNSWSSNTQRIPGTNDARYSFTIDLFQTARCSVQGPQEKEDLGSATSFSGEYELTKGDYTFTYECDGEEDLLEEWTDTVQVNLGTQVKQPSPKRNTYRRVDVPEISVYGNDRDTCEYNHQGWQEFTKTDELTEIDVDGEKRNYTRFSASNPATNTGFYFIPVRCKAGENAPWEQDNITFAVDEQPPTISVTQGEETLTSNTIQVEQTTSVQVMCEDPEIVGTSEYPDNYASGLAEIRIDDSPVDGSEHELTFELNDDPVTITCEDELGNSRSRTLTPQTTDLTGPQRPTFTAVSQ